MVVQLQWQQALKNIRPPVSFIRCLVSSFRRAYFRALAPHFSTTPLKSSIRHLSGVMMASKSVRMSLFFSSFSVSASYPITIQSSSPWTHSSRDSPSTSSLALCQTSPACQAHHIHQLFLRSVDVLNSGRHQIAASAAVGTRLYGKLTRHHYCAARLWTSALHDHKASAAQLGHVSRLTKISGPDVNGQARIW